MCKWNDVADGTKEWTLLRRDWWKDGMGKMPVVEGSRMPKHSWKEDQKGQWKKKGLNSSGKRFVGKTFGSMLPSRLCREVIIAMFFQPKRRKAFVAESGVSGLCAPARIAENR